MPDTQPTERRTLEPGTPVMLRHIYHGRVAYLQPTRCARDTDHELALFLACGTKVKWVEGIDRLASGTFVCEDRTWKGTHVLMLVAPRAWHAVWLMWSAKDWEFLCWYVNFQRPFRAASLTLDTADLSLDLVVRPDRSWSWKDEDDFAELERAGLMSAAEAASVRAEAGQVISRIEAGTYPFDGSWQAFRPPSSWQPPAIPDDWDRLA